MKSVSASGGGVIAGQYIVAEGRRAVFCVNMFVQPKASPRYSTNQLASGVWMPTSRIIPSASGDVLVWS
jgi:hypothetical protein